MNNLYKIKLSFLFFISLFLFGCTNSVQLVNTTYVYKPTVPDNTRLTASITSNMVSNNSPILDIDVDKQTLTNRVYTKNFKKVRGDKKGGEALGGLALAGLGGGLLALGSNSSDSTTRALGFVGGVCAGIGGLYLIVKPAPVDYWKQDSIDVSDTAYTLGRSLSNSYVTITNLNDNTSKTASTDESGYVHLDVRNYADKKEPGKDVPISISYLTEHPCQLTIPGSYISNIVTNENAAGVLGREANKKASQGKYSDAYDTYQQLINKYPLTIAGSSAKDIIPSIKEKAKDAINRELDEKLNSVSNEKVPMAFDKVNITPEELNTLAYDIQNMSYSRIKNVIIDGLGFMLDDNTAVNKFYSLNNSQKIYAILAASGKLGGSKVNQIMFLVNVNDPIAQKLSKIQSDKLLK